MTDTLFMRPINAPAENGATGNGNHSNDAPDQHIARPIAPAKPKPPEPRLYALAALLPDFRADAEAAHEARATGKPRGAISGLASIDEQLSGAFSPGVHSINGNAGAGKTAFALQVAASCQCPALFVSCEMSPVELLRRLTARITGTYLGRLKSGELAPDAAEALARQTIEALPMLAICDATTAPATPEYLLHAATATRRDAKHFLLLVDSLHSWAGPAMRAGERDAQAASEYDALNAGIETLQNIAARLRAPVLFVTERNRASMENGGTNAGAGTRKIEYAGETVLSLDRDAKAPENGAGEVPIKLRFSKNRNGAAGKTVALHFNGALQRFTEANPTAGAGVGA
jgi:replicative DNA helicase